MALRNVTQAILTPFSAWHQIGLRRVKIGLRSRDVDFGPGADFEEASRLAHQQFAAAHGILAHIDDRLGTQVKVVSLS